MAVNMNTLNAYQAYQNDYNKEVANRKKGAAAYEAKRNSNTDLTQKAGATELFVSNGQKQLSQEARNLLEKLKSTYTNMDFMVADFDKGDDAVEILVRGTKEFSVLFSSEELEKMAVDEKYYNEKIAGIEGAVRMSEQINAEFGFESASQAEGEITKIGISFNSDGTMTFFAELEKLSEKQRERIEEKREKATEEQTTVQKDEDAQGMNGNVKRVTVQASSAEELVHKIKEIDWSKVKEDSRTEGIKFDYSV